jgi:hypothetical protein
MKRHSAQPRRDGGGQGGGVMIKGQGDVVQS